MMADLVNQHMAVDMAERLFMFGPIIENRQAIEENHGRVVRGEGAFPAGEIGALEQAQYVEGRFEFHVVDHVVVREILHHEDDLPGEGAKLRRQARKGLAGKNLDVVEGGCGGVFPIHAAGCAWQSKTRKSALEEESMAKLEG